MQYHWKAPSLSPKKLDTTLASSSLTASASCCSRAATVTTVHPSGAPSALPVTVTLERSAVGVGAAAAAGVDDGSQATMVAVAVGATSSAVPQPARAAVRANSIKTGKSGREMCLIQFTEPQFTMDKKETSNTRPAANYDSLGRARTGLEVHGVQLDTRAFLSDMIVDR